MIVVGNQDLYSVCRWVLLDSKAPAAVKKSAFEALSGAFVEQQPTELEKSLPPSVWQEIVTAVKNRRKIEAIKLLRTHNRMELKVAKEVIEREFGI